MASTATARAALAVTAITPSERPENMEKRTVDAVEQFLDSMVVCRKAVPSHTDILSSDQHHIVECNAVLETMDSCVGCVEGVDLQHEFEEKLGTLEVVPAGAAPPSSSPLHYQAARVSLSEHEAAMIRLQIMEKESSEAQQEASAVTNLPDIDILNLCGIDEALDDAKTAVFSSAVPANRPAAHAPGVKTTAVTTTLSSLNPVSLDEICANAADQLECTPEHGLGENPLQCAICNDEAIPSASNRIKFAKLPCCGTAEEPTTIKVCTTCVLMLTCPSSNGKTRIGRCPQCRTWIVMEKPKSSDQFELKISPISNAAGICVVCNQFKEFLVEDKSTCDACFLGRLQPLIYECEKCSSPQRIPYPMYRYQPTPGQFGKMTWACQSKHCRGRYARWRLRGDQKSLIHVGDTPKSWDEDYLASARQRVQQTRHQLSVTHEDPGSCAIL